MSPEERSSIENGIWMCYTHGKLVDTDEVRFTIPMLKCWKAIAERRARQRVEGGVDEAALEGILPGTCTIDLPVGGAENEIVGNAIHDACLHELWGTSLSDAIRDFSIETIRNAFHHGEARSVEFTITNQSVRIVDDGQAFNTWSFLAREGKTGGILSCKRLVRDFSDRIVLRIEREQDRNVHEITTIRSVEDALYATPCSVELSWNDLKRGATHDPLRIGADCEVVYVVLPSFLSISDSALMGERLHPIANGSRRFIFLIDRGLSELAEERIRENFPDSIFVRLGPH